MNLTPTNYEKKLVRDGCKEILNDPRRSDVVTVKQLLDNEDINTYFSSRYKGKAANRALGTILSKADYAERFVTGKYMIDIDIV